MKSIAASYLVLLAQICLAQSSSQIVGIGHDFPGKPVAPGQVVTVWMAGAKTVFPPGQQLRTADSVPLPTSLAGFSVSFQQYQPSLLPIFSVQQFNVCPDQGARPSCTLTGITVQLPMDMQSPCFYPLSCEGPRIPQVSIAITENGSTADSFQLRPQLDSIHILTVCDSLSQTPLATIYCDPKITHADGTSLTTNPAVDVGESLTMYAVGLGATHPLVPAGTVTPGPVPLADQEPTILYSYIIDPSVPAVGATSPPVAATAITYAGLAPGQVGIYQLNFVVPAPPPNAKDCNSSPFKRNLTVYLAGQFSVDSAKICVNLPKKVGGGDGSSGTTTPGSQARYSGPR